MYAFLRNSLGLPNLSRLIEGRSRKFMDKLIDNCDFMVVLIVFVCFVIVVVCARVFTCVYIFLRLLYFVVCCA